MKGTLTSPCDCRVVQQLVADGQYANKGQVIFTLAPRDSVASIEARFPYRNAAELAPGTRVNFQVAGDGVNRSGRIVNTAPVDGDLSSEIRVQIQPDQPLDGPVRRPPGRGQHRRPARPHPAEQGRDPGHRSLTGTRP
ncbi:alginate biosynthesis protein Alg44 [Pseudomonas aeruginosa]|nr:alginate biosynthesis protein Alg44 [Pseudomonas aeruginosa]